MKYIAILLSFIPFVLSAQTSFVAGYSQGYMSNQPGSRWGISIGLTHTFKISDHFEYEQGILYSQKGSGLNGGIYGANAVSVQLNCIELPAYMNVKLYNSGKLGIGIGPCIAVQSRMKYKYPDKNEFWYPNIENANGFDLPVYLKFKQYFKVGGKNMFIQPQYAHGLLKQFDNSKTRTFTLYLGVELK